MMFLSALRGHRAQLKSRGTGTGYLEANLIIDTFLSWEEKRIGGRGWVQGGDQHQQLFVRHRDINCYLVRQFEASLSRYVDRTVPAVTLGCLKLHAASIDVHRIALPEAVRGQLIRQTPIYDYLQRAPFSRGPR